MAGLSKVIVLDPDPRAGRQVALGFAREGIASRELPWPTDFGSVTLPDLDDAGLVVIGGDATTLPYVTAVRARLHDADRDLPILFTGSSPSEAARAAGADEAIARPGAFLRDVVTIGRLLASTPERRSHVVGQLSELTNVFSLVRALAVLGRSATLTLMRGLRRGEVRFFHGEVTSCELGLLHGQAAFHQLLLWTEARFDFRHEDIVRRQQIPLSHDELLVDAEHFLEGIRESSGILSPSMVVEQDIQRLHGLGKQIPTEVHGVLRMFDGHRVLADVLEDSPYRVFETLRVAQRAVEAGLLRIVQTSRPKATWRTVLAIEEWLVGSDRDGVVERTGDLESGPVTVASQSKASRKSRRNRKQRRATPLPIAAVTATPKAAIDWGALVPRAIGADIGTLSQIVPAAHTSGEISLPPSRQIERERLESLMDTGKRDQIFPRDVTSGPSVVLDDGSKPYVTPEPPPAQSRTRSAELRGASGASDGRAHRESETGRSVVTHANIGAVAREAAAKRDAEIAARETAAAAAREAAAAAAREAAVEAAATARRVEAQIKAANEAASARALAEAIKGPAETQAREAREAAERDARDVVERQAREVAAAKAAFDLPVEAPGEPPAAKPVFHADGKASELVAALVSEVRTDAVTVTETSTAKVVVQDTLRVTARSTTTSEIHAIPLATIKETSHPLAAVAIADLPTAPLKPRPTPVPVVEVASPAVVAADAAVIAAAATKRSKRASTKPPGDKTGKTAKLNIATAARDQAASELRKDAVAFSDDEEEFFRGGDEKHAAPVAPPLENFDDLDEGYQRVGFWDRLIGRKPKKK